MSKLGYIRGFDGLRGIAVFLVFLMHENHLAYQMNVGYYGVWLFFLLSGFLITSQLYFAREAVTNRKSTSTTELLGFWRRRFLRIFPAYYFLLIVTVVLYLAAGKSLQGIGFHFTYTTNIYYEYITKDLTSIFSHFWSLAVEEQFYLLFAPLVLFARSVSIRTALLALFAISVLARVVLTAANVDEVLVYIDSFVNFGVIAVGGLTFLYRDAIISRINPAGKGSVAVILFALFIASIGVIYAIPLQSVYLRQLAFVVSVFITALLLVSVLASPSAGFTALLEGRPLAFLGRLSYGFYLYHSYFTANIPEKLLELLGKRSAAIASFAQTVHDPEHWLLGSALQISGFVVSFAVTLLVSYISWRLIEQPALRFRHSKPARPEVAVASAT